MVYLYSSVFLFMLDRLIFFLLIIFRLWSGSGENGFRREVRNKCHTSQEQGFWIGPRNKLRCSNPVVTPMVQVITTIPVPVLTTQKTADSVPAAIWCLGPARLGWAGLLFFKVFSIIKKNVFKSYL